MVNEEGIIKGTTKDSATPFCIEQASEHHPNEFFIKRFDIGNVDAYVTCDKLHLYRWWDIRYHLWGNEPSLVKVTTKRTAENRSFTLLNTKDEEVTIEDWINTGKWYFIQCARMPFMLSMNKENQMVGLPSHYPYDDEHWDTGFCLAQCH